MSFWLVAKAVFGTAVEFLGMGATWAAQQIVTGSFLASWAIGEILNNDLEQELDAKYKGTLVNKNSNIAQIPVIYGERKVGGTRAFVATSGTDNEYMYMVLVLCEGEVDSIGDIYINDVLSTDSKFSGLVSITKYTGTDTQTADSIFTGASIGWTSAHRLRGVAYLAIRLKWDNNVFGGIPTFHAVVKGRKVYNPATSTTAWSDNPALCLRDYLTNDRYGKGLSSSDIDDTLFNAAKTTCGANVIAWQAGGTTKYQSLFSCNAVLDTSKTLMSNVKVLLSGMRGIMPYQQGKYGLIIEDEGTASFDFDEDHIIGGITIQSEQKNTKFNRVVATFANPDANWQMDQIEYPEAGSTEESGYLSDDGVELIGRIDLPTITNIYTAEDIAEIALKRSRNALAVAFTATSEALECAVGDIVSVTHSTPAWDEKTFRVTQLSLNADGTVGVELLEHQDSIYPWSTKTKKDDISDTNLPDPYSVVAPTNLTATSSGNALLNEDGTITPVVKLSWTASADAFVVEYLINVRINGQTETLAEYRTATTELSISAGLVVGTTYKIYVRAINSMGAKSGIVYAASHTVSGKTTNPAAVTSLTATARPYSIILDWTNPTDNDFDHVEIRRHSTSTFGSATQIATIKGDTYQDIVGGSQTFHYWIRAVDTTGNASAWSSSVTATSTAVTTAEVSTAGAVMTATTTNQTVDGPLSITGTLTLIKEDVANGTFTFNAPDNYNINLDSDDDENNSYFQIYRNSDSAEKIVKVYEAGNVEFLDSTGSNATGGSLYWNGADKHLGVGTGNPSDLFTGPLSVGEGGAEEVITVHSSTSGTGALWFADGAGFNGAIPKPEQYRGWIQYNHSNDVMTMGVGGGTRFTLDSSGDLTITGDLTVSGTTTTVNTETINLADNIILLNSNETGTPSENGGIEVERGTSINVDLRFNESNDRWEFTNDGSTYYNLPTTSELGSYTLPTATASVLGGVKVGTNLNIASGVLSATQRPLGTGSSDAAAGNHTHSYLPLTGGVLTGDLIVSKTSPSLKLHDTNTSTGTYPEIRFTTNNHQGVKLVHNEFDGELPISGYGLVLTGDDDNTQFPSTGTLSLVVHGNIYSGGTSNSTGYKVLTTDDLGTGSTDAAAGNHTHSGYASSSHSHSYLPLGGGTLTGDTDVLTLKTTTNGAGAELAFSDQTGATPQTGRINFYHANGAAYGSGAAFILNSSESTTTILADGKLMYGEGIYSKPSSGTGAGTRKDSNWDTAYGWGNHASAGYLTSYTDTNTTYDGTDFLPNKRGTVTGVSNSGWTTAFKVDGSALGSTIRFSVVGTTGSVVTANIIDVVCNHSLDIFVTSQCSSYTQLSVKIISNNNEDFAVQLRTNHVNAVSLDIDVQPLNREVVTFTGTHTYTGASLEHDCKSHGFASSSTGGNAHEFYSNGTKLIAANDNQALHDSDALSISGSTITLKKGDNSTETVTVPSNYAASSHTHSYLPLTGGTLTGGVGFIDGHVFCGETSATNSYDKFSLIRSNVTGSVRPANLFEMDNGASGGTANQMNFKQQSFTPAVGDLILRQAFWSENSTGQLEQRAGLDVEMLNVTNGQEDAQFTFSTGPNNGVVDRLKINNSGVDVTGTVTAGGLTLGSNHRIQGTGGLFLGGSSATVFEVGAGSERMRLTSTGLGIGTSSPSAPLHTVSSSTTIARFEGSNAGNLYITNDSAHVMTLQGSTSTALAFNTGGGNERLRIDSSGNVLVGKTDASIAVEGTFIGGGSNNGTVEITRDQNRPLRLNRTSSNGSILELLKDGSTAGIIGAVGTQSYIHGGGTDVGLYWGSNNIYPYRQAGLDDATIDLGQSSKRFKDLYLSGNAYVGSGTAWHSANDGSGSTLDADLLDGLQGSSYLRSNVADTMTGALTIDVDNVAAGALRINANQTNPNASTYFAQEIYSTLSGSTTTTGDRVQGGIYLDIDSTQTGGDTSNEHRAYGVYVDLDSTGTSDIVTGGYFNATATPASGQATEVVGVYAYAEDNGGAGLVSNVHGVKGYAVSDNSTSDSNLYAGYFKTYNGADSGYIDSARGVYAEIEVTTNSPDIYGTSKVYEAQYDNNSGIAQSNTTYLFYGNYAGTLPTTAYGVYIADAVPNYFAGTVLTGDGSTTAASYSFSGDVNTGMYSPANHQLGLLVNGSRKMLVEGSKVTFQNVSSGLYVDSNKIWHSGNDASGSGLDADTVDGKHASALVHTDQVDTVTSEFPFLSKKLTGSGIGSSYDERVVLIVPRVTTNTSSHNACVGKLTAKKTGGNVFDSFDISVNSVWNNTEANFLSMGQRYLHKWVTCTYGGVEWIAIKFHYTANPYTSLWFHGQHKANSLDVNGDALKVISYWDTQNGGSVLNSEINNSITDWNSSQNYMTFNGNKIWHSGNDASGSGLDADTVDGVHASSFARSDTTTSIYRREMMNSDGNSYTYGSVLISSTDQTGAAEVTIDSIGTGFEYSTYYARLWTYSGTFTGSLQYGTLSAYSDERLKSDIKPITSALDTITQIQGITYTKDGNPTAGVTAQQLETVLPNLVHTNDPDGDCHKCPKDPDGVEIHDYKTVEYVPLIAYLIEAVKELTDKVEALEAAQND